MKDKSGISYRKLLFQSVPELWNFQLISNIFLVILIAVFRRLTVFVISAKAPAVTTSNLAETFLGGRVFILIPIGLIFIFIYVAVGLFSQIYLSEAILKGEGVSVLQSIKKGFFSIAKFFNPSGFQIIFFIVFAVPLIGMGLSISLTENFYIPNFIMSVINDNTLFSLLYLAVLIIFTIFVFFYFFSIHSVLLQGKSPKEAKKYSVSLMKNNWKDYIWSNILLGIDAFIISFVTILVFFVIPQITINFNFNDMPKNFYIPDLLAGMSDAEITDDVLLQVFYRILCIFALFLGGYVVLCLELVLSSAVVVYSTRLFLRYDAGITKRDEIFWPRPKRKSYMRKLLFMIVVPIAILIASVVMGFCYNTVFVVEDVPVVAHRLGGGTASENSLEGLNNAISVGCYGFETDVQRTKDGYYIINHDDTFKRLTGVNKAPYEMTMDEIEKLRIKNSDGTTSKVITLDELLDASKGNGVLFIELKGKTADKQMVDDVVKMVKEKDCVEDVVLISLKYEAIEYAEETYPEFETGILFFAGIGDFEKLNCDILIMEEEMAYNYDVFSAHNAGKKVMVWTVNTEDSIYKFFNDDIDGIITDSINEAMDIKQKLQNRTDNEVINDRFKIF